MPISPEEEVGVVKSREAKEAGRQHTSGGTHAHGQMRQKAIFRHME